MGSIIFEEIGKMQITRIVERMLTAYKPQCYQKEPKVPFLAFTCGLLPGNLGVSIVRSMKKGFIMISGR